MNHHRYLGLGRFYASVYRPRDLRQSGLFRYGSWRSGFVLLRLAGVSVQIGATR